LRALAIVLSLAFLINPSFYSQKQKSLAQECLAVLNSANKEQLKSLKGIGEKRANYILELRKESPEPLKNIDDLRTIIKMNKKEITKMMSAMVMDSEIDKEALC
jgi:kinesin family protein 22